MQRIAVFIDADNVAASFAPTIFEQVWKLGIPSILRAFGRHTAMSDWDQAGRDAMCEMRPQNNVAAGKNGTDIALAIDVMDVLSSGWADTFCIVSNDRDFVPLALRLRASGKTVHAICKRADDRYRKAFDRVFELEPPDHPLVMAYREIAEGRTEIALGEVGVLLRQHCPGVIPTTGKTPLRRALIAAGAFEFLGTGSEMRVRLKA